MGWYLDEFSGFGIRVQVGFVWLGWDFLWFWCLVFSSVLRLFGGISNFGFFGDFMACGGLSFCIVDGFIVDLLLAACAGALC